MLRRASRLHQTPMDSKIMASFDRPENPHIPPSPWVQRFAHLVKPGGSVLDVAAGHGRHSRFFLEHGYVVTATDIDVTDLSDLAGHEHLTLHQADLEAHPWPFAPSTFDAIVMTNYLHRPHFAHLIETLAPGGVLLIETFGVGNEKLGRPRNPDFLLQPGELLQAFSDALTTVAYEHGAEDQPRPAVRQRICAIKENEEAGALLRLTAS